MDTESTQVILVDGGNEEKDGQVVQESIIDTAEVQDESIIDTAETEITGPQPPQMTCKLEQTQSTIGTYETKIIVSQEELQAASESEHHQTNIGTAQAKISSSPPPTQDIIEIEQSQEIPEIEQSEEIIEFEQVQTEFSALKKTRGRPKKGVLADKKPIVCQVCRRIVSSTTKLIIHMRTHTGERPFGCPHCDAKFARKDKLTVHIRCHTGERPHVCDICLKSFAVKHKLTVHMRTHTGEKEFSCPHCDCKYARKDKLQIHLRTHTGLKPYACPYCPEARFIRNDKCKAHIKVYHPEEFAKAEFEKNLANGHTFFQMEHFDVDDVQEAFGHVNTVIKLETDEEEFEGEEGSSIEMADDPSTSLSEPRGTDSEHETSMDHDYEEYRERATHTSNKKRRSRVGNLQNQRRNEPFPFLHEEQAPSRLSSKVFKCHVCKLFFAKELDLAQHILRIH